MAVFDGVTPAIVGAAGAGGAAGYEIERSLRFNSADSAYLSRTPSTASNRKTFTFSCWVKLSKLGTGQTIFAGYDGSANNQFEIRLETNDTFFLNTGGNAGNRTVASTTAVYRDPSAWYHLVCAVDTTQASASDHFKFYINGNLQTLSVSESGPQNLDTQVNGTFLHHIGVARLLARYFNGYLADVHFIDGQALAATDFGEFDANNVWQPKEYSGTYGTNGFHLDFSDNSSAAALGYDAAGSNDWTVNNLSVSDGTVATAGGALPILNTTDSYGETVGSGTRTDSNSSNIVLALPMNGTNGGTTFTDQHATIKGSGSAKTITANGNTKTTTSESYFYGSSGVFDGSGDTLSVPASSDFDYGSGDVTVECWLYIDSHAADKTIVGIWTGWQLSYGITGSGNKFGFMMYNGSTISAESSVNSTSYVDKWVHLAGVRDGNTLKIFVNGVQDGTASFSGSHSGTSGSTLYIGGRSSGNYITGNINDLRIYKGVAKYSSNFIPPSRTGGSGCDSLVDSPTNGDQTDTGVGNEVVGNYATLNAVDVNSSLTLSNGNLQFQAPGGSGWKSVRGTIGVSSGKWYWEYKAVSNVGVAVFVGISKNSSPVTNHAGQDANSYGLYRLNGNIYYNNSASSYTTSFGLNTIVGVALDLDAGTLVYYYDGVSQGTAVTGLSGEWFPAFSAQSEGNGGVSFGQRPFGYAAPSGFKALCTANLTDPTIADGSTAFDATLYTGNGSTQTISGLGFSPDLVWSKDRGSSSYWHTLFDTVRGAGKRIASNETNVEVTNFALGYLSAFTSDGFTVGPGSTSSDEGNRNNGPYVTWTWDAGTSNSSISPGGLNSSVYNQDQTWSSSSSGLQINNGSAAGFFNGYLDGTGFLGLSSGNDQQYMTGQSISITASSVIEIYNNNQGSPSYKINGTSVSHTAVAIGSDYVSTLSIPPGATQLQSVSISTSGNSAQYGIKVDGKILVDSTASPPNVPAIASTVRANPSAGFSIVTYTGTGSVATVGHGLNAAPGLILIKGRNSTSDWPVYHSALSNPTNDVLVLNLGGSVQSVTNYWNGTNSSVIGLLNGSYAHNTSGVNYVAYCFAPIDGYSSFGSYTGNGSTDGPFIYTGFRPRWVMIKWSSGSNAWIIVDTARDPFNVQNKNLNANDSNAENTSASGSWFDGLSNGFKITGVTDSVINSNGGTYIYAAFAEHPFKTARAR